LEFGAERNIILDFWDLFWEFAEGDIGRKAGQLTPVPLISSDGEVTDHLIHLNEEDTRHGTVTNIISRSCGAVRQRRHYSLRSTLNAPTPRPFSIRFTNISTHDFQSALLAIHNESTISFSRGRQPEFGSP